MLGPAFAWGTLAANAVGSFLICLYVGTAPPPSAPARPVQLDLFVVPGFCGGFTTFSIFSLETLFLAQGGARRGDPLCRPVACRLACRRLGGLRARRPAYCGSSRRMIRKSRSRSG